MLHRYTWLVLCFWLGNRNRPFPACYFPQCLLGSIPLYPSLNSTRATPVCLLYSKIITRWEVNFEAYIRLLWEANMGILPGNPHYGTIIHLRPPNYEPDILGCQTLLRCLNLVQRSHPVMYLAHMCYLSLVS